MYHLSCMVIAFCLSLFLGCGKDRGATGVPNTVARIIGGKGMQTPSTPLHSSQCQALALRDTEKARGQSPQTSPDRYFQPSRCEGNDLSDKDPVDDTAESPQAHNLAHHGVSLKKVVAKDLLGQR